MTDNTPDPNMIYPGDPRHPCPSCSGRRPYVMHMFPCQPVPLSEAHQDIKTMGDPSTGAAVKHTGELEPDLAEATAAFLRLAAR